MKKIFKSTVNYYGKPAKIAQAFGGKEGYLRAVKELEEEIYSDQAIQA